MDPENNQDSQKQQDSNLFSLSTDKKTQISILDKLLAEASDIYDDIHKSSNIMDGILNIDCTNYSNITIDRINYFRDVYIDNMTTFINSLTDISFSDINESSLSQLINIITWEELELFKIRDLLDKDISEYLNLVYNQLKQFTQDIINNSYSYTKIEFYVEIYNDPIVINFLKDFKIKNIEILDNLLNNLDIDKEEDKDKEEDSISYSSFETETNSEKEENYLSSSGSSEDILTSEYIKVTLNILDILMNDVSNIYKNINNNIEINKLSELKYTLWHNYVELYEIKNIKTYNYYYLYFDLFKRDYKTEKTNIINIDYKNRKICICYNLIDKISQDEYKNLKQTIINIIDQL